jgi:hypothetical protein
LLRDIGFEIFTAATVPVVFQCHSPEGHNLKNHHCRNLKTYIGNLFGEEALYIFLTELKEKRLQ